MKGGIIDMPKLQLLKEFFYGLESPYHVVVLTNDAARARVLRLGQLMCGDQSWFISALVEDFIKSGEVVECRQYKDFEFVRYLVREYFHGKWSVQHHLVAKYDSDGKLLAYSFDPVERFPMEVWAHISAGSSSSQRFLECSEILTDKDAILDFVRDVKGDGGLIVAEDGGDGTCVSCWALEKDGRDSFSVEWWPCIFERFRMEAWTENREEVVEYFRKYMTEGLAEAQQCFEWRPVYACVNPDWLQQGQTPVIQWE